MKLEVRHLVTSFAMLTLSGSVLGVCDHSTIHKIAGTWGNNFPSDVLKRSVGVLTYVYLSPFFLKKDDPKVYCLATKLAPDETTATDIYINRDFINKYTVNYNKYEKSGKVTMKSYGTPDEKQFVLSYKNHVLVFWQCVPKDTTGRFDSLVGIAVDVEHVDDPDVQTEVQEAKTALEALELATGTDLNPCTPAMLHRVGMY